MSQYNEAETEDEGGGFLDHLFNAFGHLAKAQRKSAAEQEAAKAERGVRKPKKFKVAVEGAIPAFDAAPADKSCCTAKR